MKLVLSNFRCYADRTITIEDNAISLLNGESGKGKTSIFKAINFALFGKEQKTTMFGQRKSKVVFYIDNLVITRTRTPNHLSVQDVMEGKLYEDNVAQGFIDSIFGTYFTQVCYLSQKCLDNFFTISRDQRADLLRALSIQKFDINGLKNKNKANIKDRKATLTQATAEYTYVKRDMDSRKFGVSASKEPVFPLDKIEGQSYETTVSIYKKDADANNKKLMSATTSLKEANLKLQGALNSATYIESTKLELSSTENTLTELSKKLEALQQVQTHDLTSRISTLQTELEQTHIKEKLVELEERLKKETEAFEKVRQEKLSLLNKKYKKLVGKKDIDKELSAARDEIDFCTKSKTAYAKISGLAGKVNITFPKDAFSDACKEFVDSFEDEDEDMISLEETIKDIEKEIQLAQTAISQCDKQLALKPQTCPSCKCTLAILDGKNICAFNKEELMLEKKRKETLVKCSLDKCAVLKKDLQTMKVKSKMMADLVRCIQQWEDYLDNDIDGLDETIANDEKEIADLEKIKLESTKIKSEIELVTNSKSDVVTYLQAEIDKCKKKSKTGVFPTLSVIQYEQQISELQVALETARQQLNTAADLKVQKATMESRKRHLTNRLAEMQKLVENIEVTRREIAEIEQEIEDRSKDQQKYNKKMEEIESWRNAYLVYTEWKRLDEKLTEGQDKMNRASRELECALRFEKVLTDVESEALQSFLDCLNTECERHMAAMFNGEFSLKVRYEKTGDEEAKKYHVDIDIFKNAEEVPFDSLSGGESDRCALVLFLAFNKLGNGKMLLLDECLSSLHAESVEDIVDHIKNEFEDKTCVMTLHQTTKGIFDHIIDI